MEIVWTKQAQNSYLNNIDYLEKFWTEKEIEIFENEVFKTIEIIQTNTNIGISEDKLRCKSIVIVKQLPYSMIL